MTDPRLSLIQQIKLKLNKYVYLGQFKKDTWKDYRPMYAFNCPKHGLMKGFSHGFSQTLECPVCMKEQMEETPIEVNSIYDNYIEYETKTTTE